MAGPTLLTDTLTMQLKLGPAAENEESKPGLILDLHERRHTAGLATLNPSRRVDQTKAEEAYGRMWSPETTARGPTREVKAAPEQGNGVFTVFLREKCRSFGTNCPRTGQVWASRGGHRKKNKKKE